MEKLRIVFAGTPAFGLPCLQAIQDSDHILQAIYTQPDRPAGRGRQLQVSAVKEWATEHQIPVMQPVNFKESTTVDDLKLLNPDVMVVIAYGLILPSKILQIPKFGCINVHASLLPRWRGASPIQHALLHGDETSGVTIMQMDVGMDTGDMLRQSQYVISQDETAASLHDQLSMDAVQPLMDILNQLGGSLKPIQQDNQLATYAPKINKEDARIDWNRPATAIAQQIRAFNPWPIAFTQVAETIIRVHQASVVDEMHQHSPGTIVEIEKSGITVSTSAQLLRIERLQFPGGKVISAADWINAGKKLLAMHMVLK